MFTNLKGVFEKLGGASGQPAALKEEQLRAQQAQRRREADSRAAVRLPTSLIVSSSSRHTY